ncbi:energy transducer TonB [Pseudomonas matsuisoli]|uniref:Energy transducer TonB n=1 Tax=Pseudomonas matsuisoli TaxID=1515666 RepID=A0A917Q318_9PSED|nr:energy transducer TonB [Pseudomonas matsuisoli]GGK10176.1 hypothetical protein GCM10009304_40260 [Pseudomonas matsuisoli]
MIEEGRRRAYLDAMQINTWLPRCELPFAAPSRPELLQPIVVRTDAVPEPAVALEVLQASVVPASEPVAERPSVRTIPPAAKGLSLAERIKQGIGKGNTPAQPAVSVQAPAAEVVEDAAAAPASAPAAPPRFTLQLARAGKCLLLVDLPTGEPFQRRDPAYLLLKDILRAAGLTDSPEWIGEPVRWPQFAGTNFDQGPAAARDYVQGFIAGRMDAGDRCHCLWLVGHAAVRFAGNGDQDSYDTEMQIDGLGTGFAMPGLEDIMDEPQRKASLWKAMRSIRQRWLEQQE